MRRPWARASKRNPFFPFSSFVGEEKEAAGGESWFLSEGSGLDQKLGRRNLRKSTCSLCKNHNMRQIQKVLRHLHLLLTLLCNLFDFKPLLHIYPHATARLSVHLSVCGKHISRTGLCIVKGTRKCRISFGAIWTHDSFSIDKLWVNSGAALWSSGGCHSSTHQPCCLQRILQFGMLRSEVSSTELEMVNNSLCRRSISDRFLKHVFTSSLKLI